jgi:hypothetical protein
MTPGSQPPSFAGVGARAAVGSSRCSRIFWMTAASVIVVINRSRPPHSGQASTSMANVRSNNAAHVKYLGRTYPAGGGGGRGVAGRPPSGWGAGAALGAALAESPAASPGAAGAAGRVAPSCARRTASLRAAACGANTPCYAQLSIMRSGAGWCGAIGACRWAVPVTSSARQLSIIQLPFSAPGMGPAHQPRREHVGVLSAIDAGDRPSAIEFGRAAPRRVRRGAAGARLLPPGRSVVHHVRRASRPVGGCGGRRSRRAGRGSGAGVPGASVTVSVPRAPRRSPWCRAGAHRGLRALPAYSGNRSDARAARGATDVGHWVLRVDAVAARQRADDPAPVSSRCHRASGSSRRRPRAL